MFNLGSIIIHYVEMPRISGIDAPGEHPDLIDFAEAVEETAVVHMPQDKCILANYFYRISKCNEKSYATTYLFQNNNLWHMSGKCYGFVICTLTFAYIISE